MIPTSTDEKHGNFLHFQNDTSTMVNFYFSVPGFLDNLPHWYPLREHDTTTGVELPKPTVLPPTVRSSQNAIRMGSPGQSRGSRDSPSKQFRVRIDAHKTHTSESDSHRKGCDMIPYSLIIRQSKK